MINHWREICGIGTWRNLQEACLRNSDGSVSVGGDPSTPRGPQLRRSLPNTPTRLSSGRQRRYSLHRNTNLPSAGGQHPLSLTYSVGCRVAHCYLFRMYLLFAEGPFPDHWRRVRDEAHEKVDADDVPDDLDRRPSNFPFVKKLWWTTDISYNGLRMIGWVQEPKNCMTPHPPPSRRTFLWKTSLKLIANIVTADLTSSVLAQIPAFDNRLHDPASGPKTYLAAVPLLHRAPYVLAWDISMGAMISATHNVQALVCVGLCYSRPTLWPDMWGRWSDGYTLRRLWGYVLSTNISPVCQITRRVSGGRGTNSCDRYEHSSCSPLA